MRLDHQGGRRVLFQPLQPGEELRQDVLFLTEIGKQIGARLTRTNAKLVESMTRLGTLEKRIKRLFARESAEEMDAVRLADIRADLLELIAEDGDEGA